MRAGANRPCRDGYSGVERCTRLLAWLAVSLGLAGTAACTGPSQLADVLPDDRPARVELTGVPFFPQEDHQCGPASLATVLVEAGVEVSPDELTHEVYLADRRGSLQVELLGATRRRGLLAYVLPAEGPTLLEEVEAGHPALVLLNLGVESYPIWHYAVLIGYDRDRNEVILRSGRTQRATMSWRRFEGSWYLAGNWAMLVLEPGDMPAHPVALHYVEACAGLEAAGQIAPASACYRAASERWPEETLTMLGLVNVAYAQGDFVNAVAAYARAVQLAPGNGIARNNLAQALLDTGCRAAALAEAQRALELLEGTALEAEALSTLHAIEAAAPDGDLAGCSLPSLPE